MKNKILSLILMFVLLPGALLFVACSKNEDYNLNLLKTDMLSTVETCDNVKETNNVLSFDYSAHTQLADLIANNATYAEIADYNTLFNNLMRFGFNYLNVCSNNTVDANKELKVEIKNNVLDFNKNVVMVNDKITQLSNVLKSVAADQSISLHNYENLLLAYEDLFVSSTKLVNSLAELYFDNVLKNSNPNIAEKTVDEFETGVVVNKLRSRVDYQVSVLTQVYCEKYVIGNDIAEAVTNGTKINLNNGYLDEINALDYTSFDEEDAETIAVANKQELYNYAVQAYNYQATLKNDFEKFKSALNNVVYTEVKEDSTSYKKLCVKIVDDYKTLLADYNDVLADMLNLLGA